MCGTSESCVGNAEGLTCDAANSRCICGSLGVATSGCDDPEVCNENGTCMCGKAKSCMGTEAPICNPVKSHCETDPGIE